MSSSLELLTFQPEVLRLLLLNCVVAAAPAQEAAIQENGEANGDVKEPVDPNLPKKCDTIMISGRKERCEAAVEALKVRRLRPVLLLLVLLLLVLAALSFTAFFSSGLGSRHHRGGSAF